MNNIELEKIVEERDEARTTLERFQINKDVLEKAGFNSAQIDGMHREHITKFNDANAKFWEALKNVFNPKDILKGEYPKHGEYVYIFDDYDYTWQRGDFFNNGAVRYFTFNLYKCEPERYHFWIQLPTVFEGQTYDG